MSFSVEPGALALLALMAGLYVRAVRVLGDRGYAVPRVQQALWWTGWTFTALGLVGPIDNLSEKLVLAHMAQHLLIGDLAAPFLLCGLRSPVYAFYLPRPALVAVARQRGLRRAFRVLRRPTVAIPVWIVIMYGWHFRFAFVGALDHPLLHIAQHESFLFGGVLVWWSVVEPKKRRMPGELWKVPYILGARLVGMMLGMALILIRHPVYSAYYGHKAEQYSLSPLTDQQLAGGIMMAVDLVVMLTCVALFFYRSAEDHDRAERAAAVAQ